MPLDVGVGTEDYLLLGGGIVSSPTNNSLSSMAMPMPLEKAFCPQLSLSTQV